MAAEGVLNMDAKTKEYLCETSFAHMTRMAAEARTVGISERITKHVNPGRR